MNGATRLLPMTRSPYVVTRNCSHCRSRNAVFFPDGLQTPLERAEVCIDCDAWMGPASMIVTHMN